MRPFPKTPLEFIHWLIALTRPPKGWVLPVIVLTGIIVGMGLFILHISNATSYLSDDPKACINCHIMSPQYATWQNSSHEHVASCNDCHVPHDNVFRKYFFKGMDGTRHSVMFTLRMEPQVIHVHAPGIKVIQENCVRCHQNMLSDTRLAGVTAKSVHAGNDKLCWECHRETPHGRVNSLSAVPHARVPELSPVVPAWITETLNKRIAEKATQSSQGKEDKAL